MPTTRTQVFSEADAPCERYDGCDDRSEVTLCTIAGGGHTWPGGDTSAFEGVVLGMPIVAFVGATSTSLDASAYIWSSSPAMRCPERGAGGRWRCSTRR